MTVRVLMVGLVLTVLLGALAGAGSAMVCNVKVVSDSRPDFTDLDSLLTSATGAYQTTDEKCRALWRWETRLRRQTAHPTFHGTQVHDPIMFFNDFGYSYCSDYAAINCGLWHSMGLPVKLWDITAHTVSECFYDGRWHLFDNSLSAYYTLCDGKTVAGVEDVGKEGACPASQGQAEMGHIAKYHCAAATSPNGFLSGCDTQRSLKEEGEYVFNPNRLMYRNYYNGFELGHRYLLNLRANESYTRYAKPLGATEDYYLPLVEGGTSPQDLGTFGNGEWAYRPDLTQQDLARDLYESSNVVFTPKGMKAKDPRQPGWAIFRITGANLITSARLSLSFTLAKPKDGLGLSFSTDWGRSWQEKSWRAGAGTKPGPVMLETRVSKVQGRHEYLVKVTVEGGAFLRSLEAHTVTQLNKLAFPALTLGRNTIDVVAGEQTDTIQVWPEIQDGKFRETAIGSENVQSGPAEDWHGDLYLEKPGTGHVTFLVQAPQGILDLTFGGRFYNRAPGSSIALQYSLDEGKTWTTPWTLTDTANPWDVVHFETVNLGAKTRRALVRYLLSSSAAGDYSGCSLYSVRMAATYRPMGAAFQPLEVTYNWSELHGDQWTERSHTQRIEQSRQRYTLNVGGEDIPQLNWIRVNPVGAAGPPKYGYSDGVEGEAKPLVRVRHLWGADLARGKKYTFSEPSGDNWDAGDPEMTKLTDGVVASTYGGGSSYAWGPIWAAGKNPVITLDLGQVQTVAAARIHVTGYPYDFYRGPFSTVEVLTSADGQSYVSQGTLQTKLRAIDLDGDFLNQERGGFESLVFPLTFEKPVTARYLQYRVANPEMFFESSEIMAYDSVKTEEWREPLVMPLDRPAGPR